MLKYFFLFKNEISDQKIGFMSYFFFIRLRIKQSLSYILCVFVKTIGKVTFRIKNIIIEVKQE